MSVDTMKGLFFIVKGQYKKGVKPSFHNKVTNETSYIGGYDPSDDTTSEWYMLMDSKTFHCIACGSDFNKVLKGVYNVITKHKGSAKRYFKHVSSITSDDYYETHYLGKRPLTHDQRVKKAEGRCPRVSPTMMELYKHIYEEFGDYFSEEIEEMEDIAYDELKEEKLHNKSKRLMSKVKPKSVKTKTPVETPKKKEVVKEETPVTLKKVKPVANPRAKLGVKKLSL